ncbi:hypothetical protein ATPR_1148 [Acetobacter tropicalis NBRC 101654]|uniref:Uncharacterized protein n=1 Tax=Acetobacter tropicalis NBRC 101654 TaxID=749388 RepID=F7VCP9_9PROT|nr:hypothetical protein ATPR_1148 [Acetobacter tropicalis NBRC 101654]
MIDRPTLTQKAAAFIGNQRELFETVAQVGPVFFWRLSVQNFRPDCPALSLQIRLYQP